MKFHHILKSKKLNKGPFRPGDISRPCLHATFPLKLPGSSWPDRISSSSDAIWALVSFTSNLGAFHSLPFTKFVCAALFSETVNSWGRGLYLNHLWVPSVWGTASIQNILAELNSYGSFMSPLSLALKCNLVVVKLCKYFHLLMTQIKEEAFNCS